MLSCFWKTKQTVPPFWKSTRMSLYLNIILFQIQIQLYKDYPGSFLLLVSLRRNFLVPVGCLE